MSELQLLVVEGNLARRVVEADFAPPSAPTLQLVYGCSAVAPQEPASPKSRWRCSRLAFEYPAAFVLSALLHAALIAAVFFGRDEARVLFRAGAAGSVFEVTLAAPGELDGEPEAVSGLPPTAAEPAPPAPVVEERAEVKEEQRPPAVRVPNADRRASAPKRAQPVTKPQRNRPSDRAGDGAPPKGVPGGFGGEGADGGGGASSEAIAQGLTAPAYPYRARLHREEGRVVYSLKISRLGEVQEIRMVQSSQHELLDQAALHALQRAVFIPARRGLIPVDSEKQIAFRFTLGAMQ